MGVVCIFSRILSSILSVILSFSQARKSDVALTEVAMCCFKFKPVVTCVLKRWWNCFCLDNTCDCFATSQDNQLLYWFLQNICLPEKKHLDCQKYFRVVGHSSCAREKVFYPKPRRRTFSILIGFSGLGYPRS